MNAHRQVHTIGTQNPSEVLRIQLRAVMRSRLTKLERQYKELRTRKAASVDESMRAWLADKVLIGNATFETLRTTWGELLHTRPLEIQPPSVHAEAFRIFPSVLQSLPETSSIPRDISVTIGYQGLDLGGLPSRPFIVIHIPSDGDNE